MSKSTTNRSRRQRKSPRTIDLEINPVLEDAGKAQVAGEEEVMPTDPLDAEAVGSTGISGEPDGETPDMAKQVENDTIGTMADANATTKNRGRSLAGLTSMLVTALLGSGITLGALNLLGRNVLPGSSTQEEASIAKLQSGLADLRSQIDSSANAGIADKLAELEAKIAELQTGASAIGNEPVDLGKLTALAETARSDADAALARANELGTQLASLNETIVNSAAGEIDIEALKTALSGQTDALARRIDALEITASNGPLQNSQTSFEAEIQALQAKLLEMETSLAAQELNASEVKGVVDSLSEMGARLSGLESTVNDKISPSMQNIEKAASAAVEGQKVARSVSVRSLTAVLEQGGSFSGELASAEVLAGKSEAIDKLKAYAESGITTRSQLLSEFDPLAISILAAEETGSAGDGIFSRLMSSARSLVRVRPAGPVEGNDTAAILSRIEAGLKSGDMAEAVSQWETLPVAAKEISKEWIAAVRGRIEAENLVKTVINDLNSSQPGQG
jgi:hypothetical protein